MNLYGKKIIKFFIVVLFFNLNITCFSQTLSELLNIDNYDEVISLFELPQEELREKVNHILQASIKLEKCKFSNTDSWYVDSVTPEESYLDVSGYSGSETEEMSEDINEDFDIEHIEKYNLNRQDEKIIIIGDLHGNFDALNSIIIDLIARGILTEDLKINDVYKIICLGDYIDRGRSSLEVLSLLMILRLLNPNRCTLLKGNHENIIIFREYSFGVELLKKLGTIHFENMFNDYFKLLPSAYFVKTSTGEFLQFSHAGWSNLENERNFLFSDKRFFRISDNKSIEFLWNDIRLPNKYVFYRGAGKIVNLVTVIEEMNRFNVTMKFGGHQHKLPKQNIDIQDYSNGCACIARDPFIFVLISGSIVSLNYNTSYLEYGREGVYGYYKSSDFLRFQPIFHNEIPSVLIEGSD